jgi:hypothetical protein
MPRFSSNHLLWLFFLCLVCGCLFVPPPHPMSKAPSTQKQHSAESGSVFPRLMALSSAASNERLSETAWVTS